MNTPKTAMVELIEYAIEQTKTSKSYPNIIADIISKAALLKEKEKGQIIYAWENGYSGGYMDNGKAGEEYYTQTFKNDKS